MFGWTLKQKNDAGKILKFNYYKYTLERNRNPEDVTQAHIDVEQKWDNEFNIWNQFILNDFKKFIIMQIFSWILIVGGFLIGMLSIVLMDPFAEKLPVSFFIGLVIVLLSFALSIPSAKNIKNKSIKPLQKMDEISRDMRQVNKIRESNNIHN